jgi:trmH family RNA methyltransferase
MNPDFQLTNRLLKEFGSLDDAKGRRRTGLFVAEGTKCVLELMARFSAAYVFASADWHAEHQVVADNIVEASPADLRRLTRLVATPPVIAFFRIPEPEPVPASDGKLTLMLDRVQDPGNLGTILRTCDWMGVRTVIASCDTVDCFNPKVVQATMGGLARTRVYYTDLVPYLEQLTAGIPVYGTFLDGENIYKSPLSDGGVVIMGNEGQGISDAVAAHVSHRLLIPPYDSAGAVESLNVATATAIVLSQFRARQ